MYATGATWRQFMQTVLAKDLVHTRLTDYMWNSRIAQIQQERRKNRSRSQIQKGGIVYAVDVDREISNLQELGAKWEAHLPSDQKVYLLVLRSTVLPQLIHFPSISLAPPPNYGHVTTKFINF